MIIHNKETKVGKQCPSIFIAKFEEIFAHWDLQYKFLVSNDSMGSSI